MPDPYLVLFILDPVDDDHAEVMERLADTAAQLHAWTGPRPRAFDAVPSETTERTVGIALRLEGDARGPVPAADAPAIAALVDACALAAERLGVRVEVQLDERVLGVLDQGRPDAGVATGLRERLGVDLA